MALRSLYKPERSFSSLASRARSALVIPRAHGRPGVRVVKFKHMEDIRLQLSHVSTPAPTLRAEAIAFVPAQRAQPSIDMMAPIETAHSDDEDSSSDDSDSEDELEHDDEQPEDLNALMQTADTSSKGVSGRLYKSSARLQSRAPSTISTVKSGSK
ncbi:hypothetical protein FA95DRAFT_1563108 [Auriscalpium vulgare]|uniref:Uncharacterized protein n=1 Tax=Auriscalpium vulgare TaxID=40419 RepID=A0ACB8RHH4_9AGAM|nr:hypothetical protein FA95DRAFT_1563108 [Auriscalpium vulgare]